MSDAVHASNQVLIDGAVFDVPFEGLLRRRTAAEWLRLHDDHPRAGVAIRRVRDGEDGIKFKAIDGVVWHLRLVAAD
jgi:hypothetical protein